MNILITGLTLHNNKGGPALAYSLMQQIRQRIKDVNFILSVPGFGNNVELEKVWALHYGVSDIIAQINLKEVLFPFYFFQGRMLTQKKFLETMKEVDLVVDLVALSYMDLSIYSLKRNFIGNLSRYIIRHFANKTNTPLIRWTQSYGPFQYWFTQQMVERDLVKQKYIFARGEKSKLFLSEIIEPNSIHVFPDIAISLPVDFSYINSKKDILKNRYITLSPSSVLYRIQKDKHIQDMKEVIQYLLKKNFSVVIVPHNLMSINPNLENCDLEVSKIIVKDFKEKVFLIEDDLDPMNLKGIIAKAFFHIGGRYHSIVAALSSGTPAISLSWHEKYEDIMSMYNCGEYVENDLSKLLILIEQLIANREQVAKKLEINQPLLMTKIHKNMDLFMEMVQNDMPNMQL